MSTHRNLVLAHAKAVHNRSSMERKYELLKAMLEGTHLGLEVNHGKYRRRIAGLRNRERLAKQRLNNYLKKK